jgi:monothiol glutaredoxin
MTERNVQQEIADLVNSEPVVLFMKGSKSFPQCGFSATVVQILSGLLSDYKTVNVLSDPAIRDGIKSYSNWPTIPQLYIRGEFVGGCDIVREMFQSGDLHKALGVSSAGVEPPRIHITERAAAVLRDALSDADPGDHVHLTVNPQFRAELHIAPRSSADIVIEGAPVPLAVDFTSVERARGLSIDFVDDGGQSGFKIDNPNAPAEVVALSAKDLSARLAAGEIKELFDVRSAEERARASIAGSRLFDDAAVAHIESLDRDTPLAFYCHSGGRSQAAAEHFRNQGFRRVFNLAGGIDAWSRDVDPQVPRY